MNPNPMPPPPAATPPKRSGCVIALMVIGALLALVCIGSGIAMFVAARSDTGKKIFAAVGQGVALAEKGVNAPGAEELRQAGCPQALVMDMKEAMKLAELFIDGGLKDTDDMNYLMAACTGKYGDTLPTCEALAPVYAKAVPSEREFVIEVKINGKQKPECRQRYAGDGTFIADMK